MSLRVLHLGEVVGSAGVFCLKSRLSALRKERGIDLVIACADGVTNGFGIGKNHAMYLRKLGVDILAGGDQIFYKKDMVPMFNSTGHILRPANLPPDAPGRGFKVLTVANQKVAVVNLLGMHGFHRMHGNNPFVMLPDLVKRLKAEATHVIVDFHSPTTAEKAAMGLYTDGRVSAVFGTGLRTLTADAEILPGGTAAISDCGRTGSLQSVAGFKPAAEIEQFTLGIPARSEESWDGLEIQGCLVDLDENGKATAIEILRIPVTERPDAANRNRDEDQE